MVGDGGYAIAHRTERPAEQAEATAHQARGSAEGSLGMRLWALFVLIAGLLGGAEGKGPARPAPSTPRRA